MTRRPSRRTTVALAWLCLTALAVLLASRVAHERARTELRDRAHAQLVADAGALESALEKFETLPFAMALQPQVAQALRHPDDGGAVAALDGYLRDVQRHARLSVAYVLEPDGLTIAASNAGEPHSFVGNNYHFRPYVGEALAGRVGRFYGIGTTTAEPGYFLAQPVFDGGPARRVLGVLVLKIDLQDFERSWPVEDDPVALVDAAGVVFLSNWPDWKYHSLAPLADPARREIARTQQYAGRDVDRLLVPGRRWAMADRVETPVGHGGWRLMRFVPAEPARRAAAGTALATALASIVVGLLAFVADLRLRHARVAAAARRALIAASTGLEERIAERTADLVRANADLATGNAELRRTQQLLRDTQAELIQAGKLGMLGQMAAGVTHELNQPLTALRVFADNANAFIERGDIATARVNLGHIADAAARMGHIVGLLKTFSRKTYGTPGPVDLAAAIDNAARLLRRDYEIAGATLDVQVQRSPVVMGEAVRVEQVLVNLLRNALDAVASAPAGAPRIVRVTLSEDAESAVVRVVDTGLGIEPQARARLFEPFFTTKPSGAGLGLGLAISSAIVQAMDGTLQAGDEHGDAAFDTGGGQPAGAEFILRLPLPRREGEAT